MPKMKFDKTVFGIGTNWYRCTKCRKKYKGMDRAQRHYDRTGHDGFMREFHLDLVRKAKTLILIILTAGTWAACEKFPELPTAPAIPRCLKYGFVMTGADGRTLGDTTWVYDSPIAGVECKP